MELPHSPSNAPPFQSSLPLLCLSVPPSPPGPSSFHPHLLPVDLQNLFSFPSQGSPEHWHFTTRILSLSFPQSGNFEPFFFDDLTWCTWGSYSIQNVPVGFFSLPSLPLLSCHICLLTDDLKYLNSTLLFSYLKPTDFRSLLKHKLFRRRENSVSEVLSIQTRGVTGSLVILVPEMWRKTTHPS